MKKTSAVCSCEHVHEEVVKQVQERMPKIEVVYKMSELFKVFGDSTRAVILSVLAVSETCVCDICKVANMTKSAVSHQLKVLRENNLVKFRRQGKTVFYSLADNHVVSILNQAFEHVSEINCEK